MRAAVGPITPAGISRTFVGEVAGKQRKRRRLAERAAHVRFRNAAATADAASDTAWHGTDNVTATWVRFGAAARQAAAAMYMFGVAAERARGTSE